MRQLYVDTSVLVSIQLTTYARATDKGSSRRKSKRDRSETPTDTDSDSEDGRRRRERKERKRRKKKERKERKEKRERKRRRSLCHDDSDEESDPRARGRRSKSKSELRSPSPSRTPSTPTRSEEEGHWVEKPAAAPMFVSEPKNHMPPPSIIPSHKDDTSASANPDGDYDDSDDDVGPQPMFKINKKVDERAYGGALLRGEGSAMAAFLQDGTDTRIPRRGEIGLTSDEIASYESVGYVMSGSRHKRMNAVRMRKENQVISAEERRGILNLQKEERARREAILREEFSELVQERLKVPETRRS